MTLAILCREEGERSRTYCYRPKEEAGEGEEEQLPRPEEEGGQWRIRAGIINHCPSIARGNEPEGGLTLRATDGRARGRDLLAARMKTMLTK